MEGPEADGCDGLACTSGGVSFSQKAGWRAQLNRKNKDEKKSLWGEISTMAGESGAAGS